MLPIAVPFGPFIVGPGGLLAPRAGQAAPAFSVVWRERRVQTRLNPAWGAQGGLMLCASLGRVPSTAGAVPARALARREGAFAALRMLTRELPAGWRLTLLPDHRATVATERALALPTTAVGLLATLTGALLELDPYLAALDGSGEALELPPSAGAAGSANTWPG